MSSSKVYKSLIMEIRPRLQSVNVFVTLTNKLATESDVNVNLSCNCFEILVGSKRQVVHCEKFRIVPESLSCFTVKERNLTFRFATDNTRKELGTARFEFVSLTKTEEVSLFNKTFLRANVAYKVSCANCSQVFCNEVVFERVLPLPENSDSGDWFCCSHNESNLNLTSNLVPKLKEAFYLSCCVCVNELLLNGALKTRSGLICKRCLAWVGVVSKRGALKVWFNTVVFSGENVSFKSSALDDVFKVIQQILNNSLLNSGRIVLNCQTDFVLLWVLEKKLSVHFDLDEVCNAEVAKVLFKFDKTRSGVVSQWLNDVNVSIVDVSKPMMIKLLEHLYEMNRCIPENFNMSNDLYVSYLLMYKEN